MSKKIIKYHSIVVDKENLFPVGNQLSDDIEVLDGVVVNERRPSPSRAGGDASDLEDSRRQARETMKNATEKAGDILETARFDAQRMIEEGQAKLSVERAEVLKEAKTRGHKQGYTDGYNEGAAAAKALKDEAEALQAQTFQEREEALAKFEPQLVELVINIIDKLAITTMRVNPGVVLNLIKQGLSESNFTGEITLRVSKDDFDHVSGRKDEIMEHVQGGVELEIVADHSLGAGDCLIETPFGVVDSSLNMQLDEIKQDLALILAG
ncbi:MAG: hypothetical protein LBE35_08645 [Clostridiales bacterium]|nr:hypothetical protein [Clostridiales bacterium]